MKRKKIILIMCLSALLLASNWAKTEPTNQKKHIITLDIIRAYDERLPGLSDEDINEILEETKRIISHKFSDEFEIEFKDHGSISLDDFFGEFDYKDEKIYKDWEQWKYDIEKGADMPILKTDGFKEYTTGFLKQWELDSLKTFFPEKKIDTYEDFLKELMAMYHQKISWLKTLKTETGEKLITKPLPPWQSYVDWFALMMAQDKYDLIISNGLIIYDQISMPYPHAICKHAKAGGAAFMSPKRQPLNGSSLLVSIFEYYGNIAGISPTNNFSKYQKNVGLAGLLAHELGHGCFMLPDVYDHGLACMMNTTTENFDYFIAYQKMVKDMTPCPKCRPWVESKEHIFKADQLMENEKYKRAGNLYYMSAEKLTVAISDLQAGNPYMKKYIQNILSKSLHAYEKTDEEEKIKHIKSIIDNIDVKYSIKEGGNQ